MKVSIITPSFNQAQFIDRTIQSVLKQDYSELEFIVMDGGSTDGTLEILTQYSDRIIWKSENDRGQSHAINKGLQIATGEIAAYLNSDDTYEPNAISKVVEFFEKNPDKKWVYGKCRIVDENDREIRKPITFYKNLLLKKYSYGKLLSENFISQPATFWRRELLSEIGYFKEDEHLCLDYDYWLRIGQLYEPGIIDDYLASFRTHAESKSSKEIERHFQDELRVVRKYGSKHRLSLLLHRINYYKIVWGYKLLDRVF